MKLSNLLNIANSEWPHWRHFLEIEAKFKQVFKKNKTNGYVKKRTGKMPDGKTPQTKKHMTTICRTVDFQQIFFYIGCMTRASWL